MPKFHLNQIRDIDPVLQWRGIDLPMLRGLCYPQLTYGFDGNFSPLPEASYHSYSFHFFEGQSANLPQSRRPNANLIFLEMDMDFLGRCMSFDGLRRIKNDYLYENAIQNFVENLKKERIRTILAWKSTGWLHDGSLCVPALHLDSLDDENPPGIFWMPLSSQRLTPSEATMVRRV